jgi:hypothetical protein
VSTERERAAVRAIATPAELEAWLRDNPVPPHFAGDKWDWAYLEMPSPGWLRRLLRWLS